MTDEPSAELANAAQPTMSHREFAEKFSAVYRQMWLVATAVLGDGAEAEDIVQEAAVIAWRKRDHYRPESEFAAWTVAIVKRCAANHRRKQTGRRTFPTDPTSLDQWFSHSSYSRPPDATDGAMSLRETLDDQLLRLLSQLSDDARACLLLRVVDGLSYSEISTIMGIPAGTAMSHVYRSKQMLRRRLTEPSSSSPKVDR